MRAIARSGKVVATAFRQQSPIESLKFAQAPSGGIPARSGATPGSATCDVVAINGSGDFEKTGATVVVMNWSFDIAAAEGDRLIQITSDTAPSFLVGWSCTNEGNPTDFNATAPA